MKKQIRKFACMAMSVLLMAGILPVSTRASQEDAAIEMQSGGYTYEQTDGEILFQYYLQDMLYGDTNYGISLLADFGEEGLDGANLATYRLLKSDVQKVASGDVTSTTFTYAVSEMGFTQTSWTLEELGISSTSELTGNMIEAKVTSELNLRLILDSLRFDCPYDLYWFDSVSDGIRYTYNIYIRTSSGVTSVFIREITFTMAVAQEYQGSQYETDNTKVLQAKAAVQKAKDIVAANEGKTDLEKLDAYRIAICELTSYNTDAADGTITDYGNPWQLIWVFDEDDDTNVVCEGYAKAFQYLCDLSTFEGDVVCRTVTGTMNGGTGEGPHMWNVITIDGLNYLVDITNCDSGTVGAPTSLFLVRTEGTPQTSYTFKIERYNMSITYTYDDDTKSLYGDEVNGLLDLQNVVSAEPDTDPDSNPDSNPDSDGDNDIPFTSLSFYGASLTLQSDLTVNFKVSESLFEEEGYENPYVVFSLNGAEKQASDYALSGELYTFSFTDIAPNLMNDTIYATLYAEYEGTLYQSETVAYSIGTYCYNLLARYTGKEYTKLRTLLVDLLNYGAASQIYTGHNTGSLVNAALTEEQAACGTSEDPQLQSVLNLSYQEIANPTVSFKGAGLVLQDAVTMRFLISAESIENLSVKVTSKSGEWTISAEEFQKTDSGYYIYFDKFHAGQMSEEVYLTVYDHDTPVSNTICYSIESYAYAKQNSEDQNLNDLVLAMMKYGNAAYAYVNE